MINWFLYVLLFSELQCALNVRLSSCPFQPCFVGLLFNYKFVETFATEASSFAKHISLQIFVLRLLSVIVLDV